MDNDAKYTQMLESENAALRDEIATLQAQVAALQAQVAQGEHTGETLASTNTLLQRIIDNLPEAVFWKDTNLIYQGCNANFAIDAGVGTPANIVGKSDYDLAWKPEEAEFFRHVDSEVMQNDIPQCGIVEPQLQADGKHAWLLTNKIPLHDEQGNVIGLLGTYEDITEQKQVEADLIQSQVLLRGIVENVPAVVYVKDTKGRYILANERAAELVGLKSAELVGKTDHDILPPDIADRFRQQDQNLLASGSPVEREEIVQTPGGTRTFLALGFPMYDTEGKIYAIGGISTDITVRKQAKAEVRTLQAVVEHAPDAIAVSSMDCIVTYANAAFKHLTGYGDEAIGKHAYDFYADDPNTLKDLTQEAIEQGSHYRVLTCRRKDGTTFPGYLTLFPIQDESGTPVALVRIIRDLTDLQRAEQEREALQQQIIDAQKDAIRELSTPLIPIANHVVLMPLIGNIDSGRAQMIIETLLEGVAYHQADMVIVDITGVSVVDTQIAQALVQAAQAVRLLGAQIILTGIGPATAQTLIHLGTDLSGIATRGSLQHAVMDAIMGRTLTH